MDTIALSVDAIAVLRFEINEWRPQNKECEPPAYREPAAAGIMERLPGSDSDYSFTGEGTEHREAILESEADRIEREPATNRPPAAGLS